MALETTIYAGIAATLTGSPDLGAARYVLDPSPVLALLRTGTAASKADLIFSDTRTIAASSNEDLDLAGVLTGPLGTTLTFVKVKAIFVKAASGNTNSVVVKPASSNGFTGPFGASTHTLTIPPGGALLLAAPVSGWAVTAGTGDKINIANSSSGTSVDYDIVVVGTSA